MADIFRILDKFNITGRGIVYTLNVSKDEILRIGDRLFDLRGNQFEVKGIEMICRKSSDPDGDDFPVGTLLARIGNSDVEGTILVRELEINFLFCNHPLYPRRVDEDYEQEYQEAGLKHPCALFSYEDMEAGKLSLYGEEISGLTIFRGWMMRPEMYRKFYAALGERGIYLINTPDEYERYHLLPGWYGDFASETTETVWENEGKIENALSLAKQRNGSYIVKDFVKSRKHEWYDACFIKDIADAENTGKVIRNFVERQGSALVGGVVLRKFEPLKQTGFHEISGMPLSEEYRVFIYAGKVLLIDDYWADQAEVKLSAEELKWIDSIADRVKSNFATVDIARKIDGKLIIIEFGDGQVSGLQQIKPLSFYRAFDQ